MIPLVTWGSLRDLSNAGMKLHEGLELVVQMDSDENEEIESDAIAYFDRELNWWYAELEGEIRYVPAHEHAFTQFLCLGCRSDLGQEALRYKQCPKCGESIDAATAAPS